MKIRQVVSELFHAGSRTRRC